MNIRSWATPVLVGAFAGQVAFAVLLVIIAYCDGASAGDWLNFAGVIFGVMLTIAATKFVDWMLAHSHVRRSKVQFTTAMRSIAIGLTDLAEAEPAKIPDLARATLSLWRVASPLVDALPDLSFDHRAKIGMVQMALDESLPILASNAVLTTTNAGLVASVKSGAANLCLTILPVTELFDIKSPKLPS